MRVGDLKRVLADLPDDADVVFQEKEAQLIKDFGSARWLNDRLKLTVEAYARSGILPYPSWLFWNRGDEIAATEKPESVVRYVAECILIIIAGTALFSFFGWCLSGGPIALWNYLIASN